MNIEQKNKQKRKNIPLTLSEWFGFFFLPINMKSRSLFVTDDFNDTEVERFKKFGFEKKLKQSEQARFLGLIFYIILILIVINFT